MILEIETIFCKNQKFKTLSAKVFRFISMKSAKVEKHTHVM